MEALTPHQQFEQKLMARIRESIGDLMPDDSLKQIIERQFNLYYLPWKE